MNVHHTIDYVEFTVEDVAEAKTFYTAAFGWSFNDYGPDYVGIVGRGGEVGGLTKGEARPGGPLVIVYSDDLDATLTGLRAAGATITQEPYRSRAVDGSTSPTPVATNSAVWARR